MDTLGKRMPFPIKALQVDGGNEFQAVFYVKYPCGRGDLPPRPPKLNGHVERAQRTHTEEFSPGDPLGYDLYDGELEVAHLNWALQEWEWTCNHFRPHQPALARGRPGALKWKTPMEYICVRILRDAQHPKEENATQSWPPLLICLIGERVQGIAWG